MNIYKYILLFIFIIHLLVVQGQDSLRVDSEISIETRGQHNLNVGVSNFDCWHCETGKIADNPLFHLPIYTGLNYKLVLEKKYTLETGLFLEERSLSGGNNTLSNLIVFPKILLKVDDKINLFDRVLGIKIKGGDLWNEDVGDILRFYNIDYQGIIGALSYDKWEANFMSIGDLSRNIGLDLHQMYRFALGYKNNKFWNQVSLTINELISFPRGLHPTSNDVNIANYTKYEVTQTLNVESQVETRINKELSSSIALGVMMNYTHDQLNISSSLRYYSSAFNVGYNGNKPNYRGVNGSFTGEQLYPLKNFYRNYSQWAVYTHMGSSDLLAIEIKALWDKKMYHKFGLFYDIDLNYIYDLNNQKGLLFPLYNAGVQLYFTNNFNVKFSITNKHMDLNNFYQTFSISKRPFMSMGVHLNLERIRLKTFHLM